MIIVENTSILTQMSDSTAVTSTRTTCKKVKEHFKNESTIKIYIIRQISRLTCLECGFFSEV